MSSRALSAMVAGAAALALAASFAAPANAEGSGPMASHRGVAGPAAAAAPGAVCFSSAAADIGNAINSQNYEAANDAFDSHAAGDFKCPGTIGAFNIKKVSVVGQYSAAGPADSVNVTIRNNTSGEPGSVRCSYPNLPYTNGPSFEIALPSACRVANGTAYWVEVQANMNFDPAGQWFWELGKPADFKKADFKNPGGGFGTPCPKYQNDLYLPDCLPALLGNEVIFTIRGEAV